MAKKMADCANCKGKGTVPNGWGGKKKCPICGGTGKKEQK